jgi:hypothetical protein
LATKTAARAKKPAAPTYGITQAELSAYRALQAQASTLAASLEGAKKSLMARVEASATQEPGPLKAQVLIQESRRFSAAEVERIKGTAEMEAIRAQLTLTRSKIFSVVETV